MSKIAIATAFAALTVAVPLTMGRAEARPPMPYLAPGAAPPWADATTTATETPPAATAPIPAAARTLAAQPAQTAAPGTTPIPVNATPMQGMTTPIHAVFLHTGPSGGSSVIGTLRPGESLRILASAPGGWMQVETPTGSGWAYGQYLAPAGSTAAVQPPAPPQETIAR